MPSTTSDVDVDVHRACASPSIVHYSLLLQITRQAKQYDVYDPINFSTIADSIFLWQIAGVPTSNAAAEVQCKVFTEST